MPTKANRDTVWNKAKKVRGENPNDVRQDPYGNEIRKDQFGRDTRQGWEIDHIKPESKGGSDAIRNLQAMQTTKNRELGDSLRKRSRHNQLGDSVRERHVHSAPKSGRVSKARAMSAVKKVRSKRK